MALIGLTVFKCIHTQTRKRCQDFSTMFKDTFERNIYMFLLNFSSITCGANLTHLCVESMETRRDNVGNAGISAVDN